jgi:ABC-type Fe3+-hydroxamate transport system substrate-binding protein
MVAQTPIVVANTTPDYEKILSLEPDLIIFDGTLYGPDEITKIEELGIETLKYEPTTIDDYKEFGYRLASKIGLETPVANQLDRVDHEVSAARANSTTSPKATILLGPESGGYLVMGVEGFHASILKTCGAEPVGAAGKLFQIAKIESLIDWNPEVIYSDGHAQDIYADPRLQQIAAVKNQRVFDYHPKELVRIGGKLEQMLRQFSRDMAEMPINPRERSGQ